MTTISVPLTPELEESMAQMIKSGVAETKAALVRHALRKMAEEKAVEEVLLASQDIRSGRGLKGNLDKLAKAIR